MASRICGRRARRLWLFPTAAGVIAALFLFVLGSALAMHGSASLPGSNFEIDTDANLVVDHPPPSIDWLTDGSGSALRSDVVLKQDKPSGTADDSFGQGTKEDDPVPTVVDGSIPPNKSDLRFFGALKETTADGSFLHLFWTRVQDPSGTTNMDFEFNQSQTLSANGVTPVRTTGDLLIEYHLDNGGTVATLSLRKWNGSAWAAETALAGKAIGSINSSAIAAADADSVGSLSPRTFGEASIDLSAVFGPNRCVSFGSATLKSRASDSFTAAVKDFIAPVAVNLTNCGSVLVSKVDFDSGAPLAGAKFSVAPGSTVDGTTAASTPLTEFSPGLFCADNLLFGLHTVTEDQAPPDFDKATPDSQTFTVTDNGTCADRIKAGSPPDLTFKDVKRRGAIRITKTAKDHSAGGTAPLAGAVFRISNASVGVDVTVTTDVNGQACVDNLLFRDYTVTEISAPSGYAIDTASKTVTVDHNASCGSGTPNGVSFTDTPLSEISVSFTSLAGPGKTAATIQCTGEASSAPLPEGTPKVLTNLAPDSYTCTVVIDP
jgi:hypothetical protein